MRRAPRTVRSGACAGLKLSSCALAVHDLDQALAFYLGVLGFEVRDDAWTDKGVRRVAVGPVSQPDVRISLDPPAPAQADRQVIEDLADKGLLDRLVFVTDDCDATFEHIEAAGAEVVQEPIDRPGGVRDCAFFDPFGNVLRFTRPGPAASALAPPGAPAPRVDLS